MRREGGERGVAEPDTRDRDVRDMRRRLTPGAAATGDSDELLELGAGKLQVGRRCTAGVVKEEEVFLGSVVEPLVWAVELLEDVLDVPLTGAPGAFAACKRGSVPTSDFKHPTSIECTTRTEPPSPTPPADRRRTSAICQWIACQ